MKYASAWANHISGLSTQNGKGSSSVACTTTGFFRTGVRLSLGRHRLQNQSSGSNCVSLYPIHFKCPRTAQSSVLHEATNPLLPSLPQIRQLLIKRRSGSQLEHFRSRQSTLANPCNSSGRFQVHLVQKYWSQSHWMTWFFPPHWSQFGRARFSMNWR